MTLHIGIVACSAEGAALCYRTICVDGAAELGPHAHPEVSMHTHSLAEYMDRIYRGDWPGVAELMLASADKLARIGADSWSAPTNTIHQALGQVAARSRGVGCTSPRSSPTKRRGAACGASASPARAGSSTATSTLTSSRARGSRRYGRRRRRDEINRIIMDELVCSGFKRSRHHFSRSSADEGQTAATRSPWPAPRSR